MFRNYLKHHHPKESRLQRELPEYTVCIMSTISQMQVGRKVWHDCNNATKDLIHSCCSDCHVTTKSSKGTTYVDPLLKLYVGRPIVITENISVEKSMANGTVGKFKGLKMKDNRWRVKKIKIDGYYVNCVEEKDVEYIEMISDHSGKTIQIEVEKPVINIVELPDVIDGFQIDKNTPRTEHTVMMLQFPVLAANAVTVHKLQSRSIDRVVACEWCKVENWIYVLLSRVKTIEGLYIREPLLLEACKAMAEECKIFLQRLKAKEPIYKDTSI